MRFDSSWNSLKQYRCPEWFRDAKFGIWAHWGPQAVPMVGDWYARHMYLEGHPQGVHHRRVYGHPSVFGYKDIVRQWRAENFDPERLIDLYRRAGARYFYALAVHHDNFDCWNSRHHGWNSVAVGPGKDIIGLWAKAAKAAGLRFGVTEHHARSNCWFSTNKGADASGPHAGVPYDGSDPKWQDFYHPPQAENSIGYPRNPSAEVVQDWLRRIQDLIDQYDPDLLYSDGGVPFGEAGRELLAHFYNRNIERRGGHLEAVYAVKDSAHFTEYLGDYQEGIGVLDMERGVVEGIHPNPWQTDTCVGGWYYDTRQVYKSPAEIVALLADIVSKNGNLLLNFPPRPDGTLDEEEEWILGEVGKWLAVNGVAIYGTRPWRHYGEGPTQLVAGAFAEKEKKVFTAQDFRFTARGNTVYAIGMAWPQGGKPALIRSITPSCGRVSQVTLCGHAAPLKWELTAQGLEVQLPDRQPCDHAYALGVTVEA